jgi:imidazoleglycerol phosphate dehydratase HisB
MAERNARFERKTGETEVKASVDLDGTGASSVETGVGFLDHLVATLARHSGIDVTLSCKGDLKVDDHHTAEDCAIALGTAMDKALGDRSGIGRFGWAYAPLDEALARAVVDLSGRPFAIVDTGVGRGAVGALAAENVPHFVRSLATAARATVHVEVLRGENDHHRAEAAFKALALALRTAVARDPRSAGAVPSTKGVL